MSLAISKLYRRNGYATELIQYIKDNYLLDNFKQITLYMLENNINAQNLYLKNKFIQDKFILNYYVSLQKNAYLYIYRKSLPHIQF